MSSLPTTLQDSLLYLPQELRFGTSGRRGELVHLTQLEVYINALAELRYLQTLSRAEGGVSKGNPFFIAYDLRPSSTRFSPESQGRGELCQAIVRATVDAGMHPVNLGAIPTPALTYYALLQGQGSIMVTGSHIPFDRNGYKLNTSRGELLKVHEEPIGRAVEKVRMEIYASPVATSPFNSYGMFREGHQELPAADLLGLTAYRDRYLNFFSGRPLQGKRYLVYEHSAVGRDLLTDVLRQLGAEVLPVGRSETFVPIDTENIEAQQIEVLQDFSDTSAKANGPLDGIVSTDGDSDRPLLLGVEPGGRLRFFGGDLLGMIVAEYLRADAVVVPISCNDAIDRGPLARMLRPKTRIGSPFVIEAMEAAVADGAKTVCGWEANGGFLLGSDTLLGSNTSLGSDTLLGSDTSQDGRFLQKLATRDALLPILCVLCAAASQGVTLPELFDKLPKRFSRAALLKNFPRSTSLAIISKFGTSNPAAKADAERFFPGSLGFSSVASIDYTDGVRVTFSNGEVAHVRPSGNADELRIYAVADTQKRAEEIARAGVAEPDGILRQMEQAVAKGL